MSFQNLNRVRAKRIISLSPGIHLRRLQKVLGTSFSTTRYHVQGLARDCEIVCSKDGRYYRLFPTGTDDEMKVVYTAMQNKTVRRVLRALADSNGGLGYADLTKETLLPRSTLSEVVTNLTSVRLVARSIDVGDRARYNIVDKQVVLDLLGSFERNLLSITTDRYLDLWDMDGGAERREGGDRDERVGL